MLTAGQGTKTVYAQWRDAKGNWSTPVTDTIILDTTPPTAPTAPVHKLSNPVVSKINVHLTDKGRKVLDRVAPEIDLVHRQALAKVPPKDQETFRRILRQFRANLIASTDREKDLPLE